MFIELETLLSLFSFHHVPSSPPSSSSFSSSWLLLLVASRFRRYQRKFFPDHPRTSFLSLEQVQGMGNRSDPLFVSVFREKVPFAIFNSTTARARNAASTRLDTRRYCLRKPSLPRRHFYSEDSGEPSSRKFNKRTTFVRSSIPSLSSRDSEMIL